MAICKFPPCHEKARKDAKYCTDEHRVENARKGYEKREAHVNKTASIAADKKIEEQRRELQNELYGDAAKFLESRIALPPVPKIIKATQLKDMGFDSPIQAVFPFHDYHFGSKIDPRVNGGFAFYDPDLTDVWGDDFEGHGKMFGTQAFSMSESIGFQYLGFVDDVSNVLLSLLERYKHITIYKVHGNHGRIAQSAKDAFPPDNIELMAWQNIADRIRASVGGEWNTSMTPGGVRIMSGGAIDFYIASSPRMLLDVLGFKFLITHGHGMKGIQSTYTGAMATKLAWNSVVGETINYLVKAHLHESQMAEHEIGGAISQGGCFVGPSDFSISMSRPAASLPSQDLWFMHPKHGMVHKEILHLASVEEMRQFQEWIGR